MQWNTLPAKLQRELIDNGGAMGALLDTAALRGQIARFLHKYKGVRTNHRRGVVWNDSSATGCSK
jgi:hypothetical protein